MPLAHRRLLVIFVNGCKTAFSGKVDFWGLLRGQPMLGQQFEAFARTQRHCAKLAPIIAAYRWLSIRPDIR